MKLKVILCTIISFFSCSGLTQIPPSWTFNPNLYNYSMTVTSYIEEDCNILSDTNNVIAAFIGNECRGYAKTTIDASGKKLAFLTVYSNISSGEVVHFRFYKNSSGQVYHGLDSLEFISNGVNGTISTPFVTTTNHRPSAISVSNLIVQENATLGTIIGTCSATDIDSNQTFSFSLPSGVLDNSNFEITGKYLKLNTALDYTIKNKYKISILVEDNHSCSFLDTFQVAVTPEPEAPTDIVIDTLSVIEDNDPPTFISHIYSIDPDLPYDSFSYTLVGGQNDEDNDQFNIVNNKLYLKTKAIYVVKKVYHIRVRSTGSHGLSFEKPFNIKVKKKTNSSIPLHAASYISVNNDGKNDYFKIDNAVIYKNFSLTIFDQFGKKVFYVPNNYDNTFDGRLNGEPLPTGNYYYLFKSSAKKYVGNITIVN